MTDPNKTNNSMGFFLKDLYPGMGFDDTRTNVQPDTEDQTALVDDQKVGEAYTGNPKLKFNIFVALGALVAVAGILGVTR